MRNPLLAVFAVCLILLNACGRDLAQNQKSMTEDQALASLQDVPMTSGQGNSSSVSADGLVALLNELQRSGQLNQSSGSRNAVSGSVDLSQLTSIFSLLQGGSSGTGSGVSSILGLAQGLSQVNGGSTSKLTSIMALLQVALPIVSTIAPQYAPMISAFVTILPVIITFMQMIKKPKASVSFFAEVMPA